MRTRQNRTALGLAALAATALIATATTRAAAEAKGPDYTSSIRVEAKHRGGGEEAEAARYADQAKIDAGQAITAAQAKVPGKVLAAMLDNENGNLVYSVIVKPSQPGSPVQDVKIDAGNGNVLKVAADSGDKDEDDEESD
jgi:uncharacterized membrane protein YkoI